MGGKVIQASFATARPVPPARAGATAQGRVPGPPPPAVAARPPAGPVRAVAQRAPAPLHPAPGRAIPIDAGQLGLARGGGSPLPEAVRGKMETALGADFSGVRVHVGPQAERLGAIAFTLGSDIYFAPNRYRPDTVAGQQLLGHELAHVVQQRAGRAFNPFGAGLAVVQDAHLEAEADRLGRNAAALRAPALPRHNRHRAPTLQRAGAVVQRMEASASSKSSFWDDLPFLLSLSESERNMIVRGGRLSVGEAPIKGSFTGANLTADLHVAAADPGQNVTKKLKNALIKIQACMEYGATVHGLDVRKGVIEMRPTGGVVVKQMIELLAFVGLSVGEQMTLRGKLATFKDLRNKRIQKARERIQALESERDQRLRRSGGNLVLSLIEQHPEVDADPSPGMAELIRSARDVRAEYEPRIQELNTYIGDRSSDAMAEVFFDEHFYLLQSLIGRGCVGYFTVTSLGLVNDLDDADPDLENIATDRNILLQSSGAGHKARQIYIRRITGHRASLMINIYYRAIRDVIALL